jgi:hypothetical protein
MNTTAMQRTSNGGNRGWARSWKLAAISISLGLVALFAGSSSASADPGCPPFIDVFGHQGPSPNGVIMEGACFVPGHRVTVLIYDEDTQQTFYSGAVTATSDHHADSYVLVSWPHCDHHHLMGLMQDQTTGEVAYTWTSNDQSCF